MFASCFLKRALPFTLTLVLGALLGGFVNLFDTRTDNQVGVLRVGTRRGCSHSRGRFYATAKSTNVIPVSEPNTKYTKEAWERGVTGVVRLRVTFDASGEITQVETVEGLPYGLTEEAKKVAWQKKFIPATVDGQPVTVTQDVDYVFSLSDRMAAGL
jgi:TonB family protein